MSERPESPAFKLGGALTVVVAILGLGGLLWARQSGLKQEGQERQDAVAAGPRVRVVKLGPQAPSATSASRARRCPTPAPPSTPK